MLPLLQERYEAIRLQKVNKSFNTSRSEKVWPFILFFTCTLISLALAGYSFYLIVQLNLRYYEARCSSAHFVEEVVK